MPAPRKASATKKATKAALSEPVEEPVIGTPVVADVTEDAEASQREGEARREVAQRFLDEGYAIVNAGQDEDGRHWMEGAKDGGDPERRYVKIEEQS